MLTFTALLCFVVGNAVITVVARFFSSSQKGSACRCFLLFLLYEVISAFIVAIYGRVVFKAFTDAGTSLTTRLLLRSVVHSTVVVLLRMVPPPVGRRTGHRAASRHCRVHWLFRVLPSCGAAHAVFSGQRVASCCVRDFNGSTASPSRRERGGGARRACRGRRWCRTRC